jgi:hypothetical protein
MIVRATRRVNLLGMLLLPAVLGACAPPSPATASAPSTGAAARASAGITPDRVFEIVAFLAADSLRGRDTPSPGLETAAAFLATQHRSFGLDPAGDRDSFFQRYPFQPRRFDRAPSATPDFVPNVVAVWRGSDPSLQNEYVVLSAHFDHVGVGRPVNGDSIYNGADDNASGTAALLEVARAFSVMGERPRRSILFLHVSGEEHGLLGSRWFSDNPTVPIDRIVANINVDMIARNAPDSIVVIGKDYSSLGRTVERVGANHPELGLTVSDDLWPQERFFYRSDHFNFARLEIPALFFFSGVHEDYHRPSDTADRIDPDKAARVARLIFHTALEIANDPTRPRWTPEGLAEIRRLTR